jgi:pimeloyl-ACP methyl ester carboxylesterase
VIAWAGGRPALVGASLGGLAALIVAGEIDPELATALVLVDVTPRVNPSGSRRIIGFMRATSEGFASLTEAADAVAGYIPNRPRPAENSGLERNLRQGLDGRYRWHWDPALIEFPDPSHPIPTDRLIAAARRVKAPTLLVQGALSDVVTADTANELQTLIPHAEHVSVGNAGHMVAGDQNDVFTAAVVEFLDRVHA